MVKNLPTMPETRVQSLGWKDPLQKGIATHSSILAWEIQQTEEPGYTPWGCEELDTFFLPLHGPTCSPSLASGLHTHYFNLYTLLNSKYISCPCPTSQWLLLNTILLSSLLFNEDDLPLLVDYQNFFVCLTGGGLAPAYLFSPPLHYHFGSSCTSFRYLDSHASSYFVLFRLPEKLFQWICPINSCFSFTTISCVIFGDLNFCLPDNKNLHHRHVEGRVGTS